MRGPHNILRLIRTGATLERTGAMNLVLDAFSAPWPLRVAAKVLGWPFQWLGYKGDPNLPPATRAITALGPAYIKFGQVLSTRPDVVGDELATQLRVLQDQLPSFPTELARETIASDLDASPDDLFSEFSDAIAAASIAQVHRARLRDTGQEVAVKVLRPNIVRAFRKDIDAFYLAAWFADKLAPGGKRLRPVEVIAHFESVVMAELDLRIEAAAAGEFAANTDQDEGFRLPRVYWQYSDRHVMVMDWVDGIPAGDNAALDAAGIDRRAAGRRILALFLQHALRDGYFHADMHQGNLKIAPNGDLLAYDFGIMGRIDEYTRRVYAEIIYGFISKDYRRVAEVHFEAGYVPADQDVDAFASALRSVGEPIFGMSATQISMGRLLAQLFDVTERFGMETRTELILLQRTMVVVEGVSRSLHEDVNMWETARPIVEDYVKTHIGPRAALSDLAKTIQVISRFGPKLPQMAEAFLKRAEPGAIPSDKKQRPRWRWIALGAALGSAATYAVVVLT